MEARLRAEGDARSRLTLPKPAVRQAAVWPRIGAVCSDAICSCSFREGNANDVEVVDYHKS